MMYLPVYTKLSRYSEINKVEIEKQIGEILDQGIIRESSSPVRMQVQQTVVCDHTSFILYIYFPRKNVTKSKKTKRIYGKP